MLQQLLTTNRFVSLAPDDPDNSDTDPEATEPHIVNKPQDDVSTVSDDTVYYLLMMAPPTSKQGLNLSQEKSGKSPSLLISMILMECYALATNLTQISAPSKKLKLPWAWITCNKCGSGQMLALARCHAPPHVPHTNDRPRGCSSTCC